MEKRQRIFVIIQLCIAFSALFWIMGQPFLGDLFTYKSRDAIFRTVLEEKDLFKALPPSKRTEILRQQEQLEASNRLSFTEKLVRSFLTIGELSPFLSTWLILSIVLGILLLLRIDGATQATWILVLLAAAYVASDQYWGAPRTLSKEEQLFPSEQLITEKHLSKPLHGSIIEQQEQLKAGWENYLATEWGKDSKAPFTDQLRQGRFAFNVARLEAISNEITVPERHHPLFLVLFGGWTLLFSLGSSYRRA